jgi:hypothetical protein
MPMARIAVKFSLSLGCNCQKLKELSDFLGTEHQSVARDCMRAERAGTVIRFDNIMLYDRGNAHFVTNMQLKYHERFFPMK